MVKGSTKRVTRSHAITRLPVWGTLGEATRAVVEETLGAPVSFTSGPVATHEPAYAIACAMTDAEHQLELTVLLSASTSSVGELGRMMLDDASLDVGQAAMGELSNIVAGRLKTFFIDEGYTFSLAIYSEADEGQREALQRLSLGSAAVALVAGERAAFSAQFFIGPIGAIEVSGEELLEGGVLAEEIVTDRCALTGRGACRSS